MQSGPMAVNRFTRWNETEWRPMGMGFNGIFRVLGIHEDALCDGGEFTEAGNTAATRIARWGGTNWSALGFGLDGTVRAITSWRGYLIAAGDFRHAGDIPANRIARYEGTAWSTVGVGANSTPFCVSVFDGSLFCGGQFPTMGGKGSPGISQWTDPSPESVDDPTLGIAPRIRLARCEPNPSKRSIDISYWLARQVPVRLCAIDPSDRWIETLVDRRREALGERQTQKAIRLP